MREQAKTSLLNITDFTSEQILAQHEQHALYLILTSFTFIFWETSSKLLFHKDTTHF